MKGLLAYVVAFSIVLLLIGLPIAVLWYAPTYIKVALLTAMWAFLVLSLMVGK